MKQILFILGFALLVSCSPKTQTHQSTEQTQATAAGKSPDVQTTTPFYNFTISSLDQNSELNMADYQGKKILLVNVASKCGYTPQYKDLQKLHETYGDKLQIIGFPCNQFMGQEPGSKEEIASFCQKNYGVTFPISSKIDVKGNSQHPIYQWLTQKERNGKDNYKVSWNFNKFLIDENGNLIGHYGSKVGPMSKELLAAIGM